ncbi:DUF3757 domain-containing protein [Yersinia kristensenii]|uniref:DUF3757 domain-containing protein n=1 Tax=Yersinia kristensenii TaxID=28152 RepID=UPI000B6C04FA|nr:DUF3757 domain-containing protein [Yersinia kristensenii]MBW5826665.1 DUF3757 domain-containing protein [Yersinia kristensenii]OWF84026.1 hypothetical protein B4907_10350 [Yersinia kristensenii]
MKYKLPCLFLFFAPFSALATLHCPAINEIKHGAGVYTAVAADDTEWSGTLQGELPQFGTIKDFSEAMMIVEGSSEEKRGKFQKCTYNLHAEGKQIDMFYENKAWLASISDKPHWKYEQGGFLNYYTCSGVAPEACQFDIVAASATF